MGLVNPQAAGWVFYELLGTAAKAPTTTTVWEDWDISAIVPADTKAVEVSMSTVVGAARTMGCRKNGSALNRIIEVPAAGAVVYMCEVDALRIIEIVSTGVVGVRFGIAGYWI